MQRFDYRTKPFLYVIDPLAYFTLYRGISNEAVHFQSKAQYIAAGL